MEIQLLSRNGKIKSFVGAIAIFNFQCHVCIEVSESKSIWAFPETKETHEEKLWLSEIHFKDIASKEFFKPWSVQGVQTFLASFPVDAGEQIQKPENNNEENIMAKKTTKKKTVIKSERKHGKIEFADTQLQSGKFTKAEVAANLEKEFGMPEKTAKNTVNWAASTMKDRTGKVSKHLPKTPAA